MLESVARTIGVLAAVAVVLIAFLYLTQRGMIYFPSGGAPVQPADAESVELVTDDGLRLGAWFLPSATAGQPGPAVLVANGNAGNRGHRLPLARALADLGYHVLLFDYRGYGGNPGSPSEDGLHADARAAARALIARPEVEPDRVVYFGESLGAAVLGGLATELRPAALVMRSPPPSIAAMARHHYPYLPVIEGLLLDRYALIDQVAGLDVPMLVIVTERDEVVPTELSRWVYDAAREPKRWAVVDASGHNDPALVDGEELLGEVADFLREHLP
ncbi:MAG: alpha/beta hydrolase [Candidatus Limnocylindria bacterium]